MSVGELKTLIPIVKWGQRKDLVILRVEVTTPDGQADNVRLIIIIVDGHHLELSRH